MLGIARKTVNKYTKRIEALNLSYSDLLDLEDKDLVELFESPRQSPNEERLEILKGRFPVIEKELKRVGVTRWML